MEKHCSICGNAFEAIGSNRFKQVYCSRKCFRKANYLKHRDKFLEKSKKFREEHPDKVKESVYNWRINNPEKTYQYAIKWQKNNPEKLKEVKHREYLNNIDRYINYNKKYKETHKEEISNYLKEWRKENSDYINNYVSKRRVLKINSMIMSGADINKIIDIYRQCKEISNLTGIKHEVDHIIPLKGKELNGTHHEENLQILPKDENRRKGNKIMLEYIGDRDISKMILINN
jgi:hypothetical protein